MTPEGEPRMTLDLGELRRAADPLSGDGQNVLALIEEVERLREEGLEFNREIMAESFSFMSHQEAACRDTGHTVPAREGEWSRGHWKDVHPCYCLSGPVRPA